MKASFLLIGFILAASVMCGTDSELLAGISKLDTNPQKLPGYFSGCWHYYIHYKWNVPRNQIAQAAEKVMYINFLGKNKPVKMLEKMNNLRFGKHTLNTNFETHKDSTYAGILLKAFVGDVVNGNFVYSSAGVATSFCRVNKFYAEHRTRVCNKKPSGTDCSWKTTKTERGNTPQEIDAMYRHLKADAAKLLKDKLTEYVLSNGGRLLEVTTTGDDLVEEKAAMVKLIPEVTYDVDQIENIFVTNLKASLNSNSDGKFTSSQVMSRITTVIKTSTASLFLYSPDEDSFVFLKITKDPKLNYFYDYSMTVFSAGGKFPAGAFASKPSGSSWNVENQGATSNGHTISELVAIFQDTV